MVTKDHKPEHTLVQRRTPLFRVYIQDMLKIAAIAVEKTKELVASKGPDELTCQCGDDKCTKDSIDSQYWTCLESGCGGALSVSCLFQIIFKQRRVALVSAQCNDRIEEERPWSFERRKTREHGSARRHSWMHTMARGRRFDHE